MTYASLKAQTLALRKERDPLSPFAVAVLSKAQSLAKDDSTGGSHVVEPTDAHAVSAIKGFLKGIEETLKLLSPESERYEAAVRERDFLAALLPAQATDDEVRASAAAFIESVKDNPPKSLIGATMAHLKTTFGDALNSQSASVIVKDLVNGG